VRREQGRRRLRMVVAAVAVVVLTGLGVGALYSPLLNVRNIRISAPASVPPRQLLAIAGLSRPRPLVDIDTGQVAARLDAVPTLGAARVTKQWPATLSISVVTRTPVAVVARAVPAEARPGTPATSLPATSSPGWATVDATGRVLATVQAAPGLPVLQGLGEVPAPGQWLAGSAGPTALRPGRPGVGPLADLGASPDSASVPGATAAALAIVAALPASLRSHVLSVTVASGGQLRMEVVPAGPGSAGISVDLGDGSRLAAKLTALATLLSQANLAGVAQIDLTVPDRPATLTAR
jgi:cell division septal protein FtsQ